MILTLHLQLVVAVVKALMGGSAVANLLIDRNALEQRARELEATAGWRQQRTTIPDDVSRWRSKTWRFR